MVIPARPDPLHVAQVRSPLEIVCATGMVGAYALRYALHLPAVGKPADGSFGSDSLGRPIPLTPLNWPRIKLHGPSTVCHLLIDFSVWARMFLSEALGSTSVFRIDPRLCR
jgi:hypothetical protein